jgi:adenine-specific DNA-methyltransferase
MIGNISKNKRNNLIAKLDELKQFIKDKDNDGKFSAYLSEMQSELKSKKYGLVFEEHREEIDDILDNNEPILTEQQKYLIPSGKVNFLIEGDNLASLKLLEKTHKGLIDCIYIDPPYNTGKKDFIYNDVYIDINDSFRHSKWLSFMNRRLEIAKNLLSNTGVIFISIDDNELAQLKCLCDNVFQEQNFISILSIENNPKGRKNSKFISVSNDYCLVYAKNTNESYFIENIPKAESDLTKDENGNYVHNSGKRVLVGEQEFNDNVVDFNSDKHYTVYYNSYTQDMKLLKENNLNDKNTNLINKGYKRYCSYNPNGFVMNTYSMKKFQELFDDDALEFKSDKIYGKNFSTMIRMKSIIVNKKYKAIIDNKSTDFEIDVKTTSAKQSLESLLEQKKPFNNTKNVGLLKLLLTLFENKNIKVLDFFAGSGTTAQAVMELNKQDGGIREFILCTNNENGICENVTFERIKRIIKKEDYKEGIKYFKVDYVDKKDKVYYEYAGELINHIKELVELENGVDFSNNNTVSLVLYDDEMDNLLNKLDFKSPLKKVYVGHDIMLSIEQQQKLVEHGIEFITIPEYYYKENV